MKVNPDFQAWKIKDKALLSLINSTLTPQVFSLVVGITNSRKVWNTLEQRFTSTSRANTLNLKLELQSLKKGIDSVNSFLQKIKIARDKLLAIGVIVDNKELFCTTKGICTLLFCNQNKKWSYYLWTAFYHALEWRAIYGKNSWHSASFLGYVCL